MSENFSLNLTFSSQKKKFVCCCRRSFVACVFVHWAKSVGKQSNKRLTQALDSCNWAAAAAAASFKVKQHFFSSLWAECVCAKRANDRRLSLFQRRVTSFKAKARLDRKRRSKRATEEDDDDDDEKSKLDEQATCEQQANRRRRTNLSTWWRSHINGIHCVRVCCVCVLCARSSHVCAQWAHKLEARLMEPRVLLLARPETEREKKFVSVKSTNQICAAQAPAAAVG